MYLLNIPYILTYTVYTLKGNMNQLYWEFICWETTGLPGCFGNSLLHMISKSYAVQQTPFSTVRNPRTYFPSANISKSI